MTTRFFERQDEAKRNTGRLIALLVLGMAGIAGTTYVAAAFLLGLLAQKRGAEVAPIWNAPLFFLIAGGTMLVVLGASFFRTAQLREGGGAGVALAMGGRELAPGRPADAEERKLLNVVEEMAIASGVAMPRLFIMEGESGINAFAAGWDPADAVIGVTRGAVESLTRDELQGVIAHEFSHILNGDMRRNIRLMGLVFGLLALAVVGRILLEMGWYARPSRDRDGKGDPRAILALLGLLFVVMGYVGAFFGQLMQAAISRQREFLADASAVQFTRNPDGLAGALKQIGASSAEVTGARAKEANHMFFGEVSSSLFGFLASHPPLEERILRLDPSWDGVYPQPHPMGAGVRMESRLQDDGVGEPDFGHWGGPVAGLAGNALLRPSPVMPTPGRIAPGLPPALAAAAADRTLAGAMVCALLLDRRDAGVRQNQISALAETGPCDAALRVASEVLRLPEEARMGLLDAAAITAAKSSSGDRDRLLAQADAMIGALERADLYVWSARRVLATRLSAAPSGMRHASLREVLPPAALVLSVLARAGGRSGRMIQAAFGEGAAQLGLPEDALSPPEKCRFAELDAALDALACASPDVRRQIMQACAAAALADGRTTAVEGDLLHAFEVSLGGA